MRTRNKARGATRYFDDQLNDLDHDRMLEILGKVGADVGELESCDDRALREIMRLLNDGDSYDETSSCKESRGRRFF
jgi:hypothetical protein